MDNPPFAYADNQDLIADLRLFATTSEFHSSAKFQTHQTRLSNLLDTPRLFFHDAARPRLRDFLRIAHWNLEKGKYFDGAIRAFRENPVLREADLISINEADVGMNRSAHRFVARELGDALGMHTVFAPVYLEFSKGYGDDLNMPGENTIALQGNAILSRHELRNPRIIRLPVCYDHFDHAEKRIGNRNALAVEVLAGAQPLTFVTTHLEVRNTPGCRARQMAAIIEALRRDGAGTTAIIAGDFNSNTFARGGRWRTLRGFARVLLSDPERLMREIAAPQAREPLFALLQSHGFTEAGFNSQDISCRVPIGILEDRARLPAVFTEIIERKLAAYNNQLDFRLDWMLGRGVRPLTDQELTDSASGVVSQGPRTIPGLQNEKGAQISDHDPITVEIRV
ncbi:MAG: endonuclease/exonuclease/phosphatase family protein [Blastocatellia bacterium]